MEEGKGVVKHVVLGRFKGDVRPERVEELIARYTALVSVVEPMKAFHWAALFERHILNLVTDVNHNKAVFTLLRVWGASAANQWLKWGKDMSRENLHQGFTHIFESTFESVEGIAEYVAHPSHVEFANEFLPALEKVIIIDYKPTADH